MNIRTEFSEVLPEKTQGVLRQEDIDACAAISGPRVGRIRDIVNAVADATGIHAQAFYGRARGRKVAHARQLIMYVAHREGFGLSAIARALNRDHSTVAHGIQAETERRAQA